MSVILGVGAYRYEVVDDWAKLPPGWEFNADVAAVGVDAHDRVYAFNRGAHPMVVLDRDGNFLRSWGEGLFRRAHGVHMAPDDTLWLTDDGDHTVRHCTLDGKVLLTIGIPGTPKPALSGEPFNRCTHTALSPQGELYVSDGYGNARVHKFAPNGTLLTSWGSPGTDPGQFNIPHNICCDADGWVYVADRENHRIQVFDGNGKFETQWVNMHRPSGLFLERGAHGNFYVGEIGGGLSVNVDMPNIGPRVSIYGPKGDLLAAWAIARPGSSPASSSRPTAWPSTPTATSTWARSRTPTGAVGGRSRRACAACRSSPGCAERTHDRVERRRRRRAHGTTDAMTGPVTLQVFSDYV